MSTLGRKQAKSVSIADSSFAPRSNVFFLNTLVGTLPNLLPPHLRQAKLQCTHVIQPREQKPKNWAERWYMWFVPFLFAVLSKGHLQVLQLLALMLAKVPCNCLKPKSSILLWEQDYYLSHDCLEDTVKVSSFLPQISRRKPTQLSRQEMYTVTINMHKT